MSIEIRENVLRKGWKRFTVMHKDRKVASIREDGACTIYSRAFLPYNLYLDDEDLGELDSRLNNLNNFYYWCASRVLTLDRKYAKEILASIGAKQAVTDRDRAMISISYHALSLTDVYWVKLDHERIRYSDICLFDHSLSTAFSEVSLGGRSLTAQNASLLDPKDAAGDVGTMGVAPKAWIRKDDGFYLLKDGDERDVRAELLASKILDCFDIDHVRYEEDFFDGKSVSSCRILTSKQRSIVPIEYVEIYCINHDISRDEFVLQKDPYDYHMMNIADYLIGNTDRHWGNWGFFVDNDTNQLTKLHPLMDLNKAFKSYDTVEGSICQTNSKRQSQMEAAIEGVKAVGLNQIRNVDPKLFKDPSQRDMFFKRLDILRNL